MKLVLLLYKALLCLAPRGFRDRFGAELLDSAARALAVEERNRGRVPAWVLGLRYVADLALSVVHLRLESPEMRFTLVLLPLALLVSFATGWVDRHSEEVQPAVLLLVVFGAVFSFLDPRRAWLWWLVLGSSIPATLLWSRARGLPLPFEVDNFGWTFLAFLPAGAGTLLGLLFGHVLRRRVRRAG
jgi:hypothetical protein